MAFHKHFYAAYGVRLPDDFKYDDEQLATQLDGSITHVTMICQATDPVYALVITETMGELEPGDIVTVNGDSFTTRTEVWDEALTSALAVIQTTPPGEPGWLFMLDES